AGATKRRLRPTQAHLAARGPPRASPIDPHTRAPGAPRLLRRTICAGPGGALPGRGGGAHVLRLDATDVPALVRSKRARVRPLASKRSTPREEEARPLIPPPVHLNRYLHFTALMRDPRVEVALRRYTSRFDGSTQSILTLRP